MAKPEELYQRWKRQNPTEVSVREFEKVVEHYLGKYLRRGSGTSHMFIVEHPALASLPTFRNQVTFMAPTKSGQKVKGVYVGRLLKAIECVSSYEGEVSDENKDA